jgi:outer membrane assembly lipoprotein YfiO
MTHWTQSASVIAVVLAALSGSVCAQGGSEFRGGQWQTSVVPAEGSAAGEVALIGQYVDQGEYRQAVKAAQRFLKLYGDPAAREEVMVLAGESEIKRQRLLQGYEWFEKQLAEFPDGRFSARALDREFEVAEAFLAGQKQLVWGFLRLPARDEGLEILSRIAEHVPGTPMAQRALLRIGEDHFGRGEWIDAAEAYDRYLAAFPRGDKAAEAMLKAAQATYQSFTGIGRDETPLIEAEQRYRQFARAFPISAAEAGVDATLEQIRSTRAAKLLAEARFYERVGRTSAAVFAYRLVIETYPHTDAASQAELALTGLTQALAPPASQPADEETEPARPDMPSRRGGGALPPVTRQNPEPVDLDKLPVTTAPAGGSP